MSESEFNKNNKCRFTGITDGEVWSSGSFSLDLIFHEGNVRHDFQVVPKLPIAVDAILGDDFLRRWGCKLDYSTNTFSFNLHGNEIVLPFTDQHKISLPARCQKIVSITLNHSCNDIILHDEVAPGVFVANTLVSRENPKVKFLNTNNCPIVIGMPHFKTAALSNYSLMPLKCKASTSAPNDAGDDKNKNNKLSNKIYTLTKNKTPDDRIAKIINAILSKTPDPYKNEMSKLANEFVDIFALAEDPVTTTNVYEQKLRFKYNQPVYSRNYRAPHSHQQIITGKINKMLSDKIIEPAVSPFNSPVLLVPKKSDPRSKKKQTRVAASHRLPQSKRETHTR